MRLIESSDMGRDTLHEWRHATQTYIVASLEDGYEAASCVLIRDQLQLLCQPFVIKLVDTCVLTMYVVLLMGIKSS